MQNGLGLLDWQYVDLISNFITSATVRKSRVEINEMIAIIKKDCAMPADDIIKISHAKKFKL